MRERVPQISYDRENRMRSRELGVRNEERYHELHEWDEFHE